MNFDLTFWCVQIVRSIPGEKTEQKEYESKDFSRIKSRFRSIDQKQRSQ